jgi:hypothetical protein
VSAVEAMMIIGIGVLITISIAGFAIVSIRR